MKDVYISEAGKWSTQCCYEGCRKKAAVASHVWVEHKDRAPGADPNSEPFLVPSCQGCNMNSAYKWRDAHRNGSTPYPATIEAKTELVKDVWYDMSVFGNVTARATMEDLKRADVLRKLKGGNARKLAILEELDYTVGRAASARLFVESHDGRFFDRVTPWLSSTREEALSNIRDLLTDRRCTIPWLREFAAEHGVKAKTALRKEELVELMVELCETMMDSDERRARREQDAEILRVGELRRAVEAEARREETAKKAEEQQKAERAREAKRLEAARVREAERRRKAVEEEPVVLELLKKWGREGNRKRLQVGKYGIAKVGGVGFTYTELLLACTHPDLPGLSSYMDWIDDKSAYNDLEDRPGQGTLSDFNDWLHLNIDEDVEKKNIWEHDNYLPPWLINSGYNDDSLVCNSLVCSWLGLEMVQEKGSRGWLVDVAGWSGHHFATIGSVSERDSTFRRLKKVEEDQVYCKDCRERAVRKKSNSEKNPGKWYWSCPDRGCSHPWLGWC